MKTSTLLLALGLLASPVMAQSAPNPTHSADADVLTSVKGHTIDMSVQLKGEDGTPAKECVKLTDDGKSCQDQGPVTLGHTVAHALNGLYGDEQNLSGDERFSRGMLAYRIRDEKHAVLSVEDLALIKKCVGKAYPPFLVAQIFPLVDPSMAAK